MMETVCGTESKFFKSRIAIFSAINTIIIIIIITIVITFIEIQISKH